MATTFKDRLGREWDTAITYAGVTRVKKATDILLKDLYGGRGVPLSNLYADGPLLCTVVYHLVNPPGVTEEQFADGIDGDVFEALAEAFDEALVLFCPKPTRESYRKLRETGKAIGTKALAKNNADLTRELANLDEEKLVTQTLARLRGEASGKPTSDSPANAE